MTMGRSEAHDDLFRSVHEMCTRLVGERSIFRLLAEQGHLLLPDEMFADLYSTRGRRSIAPRVMATVMVLQRLEGLSDCEAVDRLQFDIRYKWACGLPFDAKSFDPTLLVDMRARLRNSEDPDRIFRRVLDVADRANLLGKRRIIDSMALYDAVATQDTVTLVRNAIVIVLRALDDEAEAELRKLLKRDDPYEKSGKPSCAWDDKQAREELVDELTRDAHALLLALDGKTLTPKETEATLLLAKVVGQDIEEGEDGVFRIMRGVAKDRIISTVDPDARHGHKTSSRSFDGYKGHIVTDADSEIITATEVTAGNAGDASVAEALLGDILETGEAKPDEATPDAERPVVYGDASYGTADLIEKVEEAGVESNMKVQQASAREGMFPQDAFDIDTQAGEVCCPAGVRVHLQMMQDGSKLASFGKNCESCPLREKCTSAKTGRKVRLHRKHAVLERHRSRQRDDGWRKDYRAVRPRVERKIAHMMRRRHGGRRARMRGRERVANDFSLLAATVNIARLAALGIRINPVR